MYTVVDKKKQVRKKQLNLKVKTQQQMERIQKAGADLLSSRAHVNKAPLLINLLSSTLHHDNDDDYSASDEEGLQALLFLQSFFIPLLKTDLSISALHVAKERLKRKRLENENEQEQDEAGASTQAGAEVEQNESTAEEAEAIYRNWLKSLYSEYIMLLRKIVFSSTPSYTVRAAALDAIMEFARKERPGRFYNGIYFKLFETLVCSNQLDDVVLDFLASKYFMYDDVRYFSYTNVVKIASNLKNGHYGEATNSDFEDASGRTSLVSSVQNILEILMKFPSPGKDAENSEKKMWSIHADYEEHEDLNLATGTKQIDKSYAGKFCAKSMRAKMSKAWMLFLRLPLTTEVYKKILVILDKSVIPWLTNPILLSDFLTRSYDIGGVISVMALSSLFVLMTQHGLEYPEFYNKLYALLEPSIFMAKYRSRFFELLDACLNSPLLPAYLAGAFAKKLSRLALSSPPSGSLVVIALIHNLLRRHPSINTLVHQVKLDDATINDTTEQIEEHCMPAKPGVDPFVSEEKNTAKCKALQSSLWEIETLRRHYCPAVSRFVASLETDLTVRAKTTEVNVNDFSSGSYGTIFADEVGRRIKQVPLAFYKTVPSRLFSNKISEKDGSIIDFPGWNFNQPT